MNSLNRLRAPLLLAAALAVPLITNGCSAAKDNPLCCTEFKAGAAIDVKIGGGAEAQVAVQAIADFSGVAQGAIDDITTACRGIATDLGADKAASDAAEQNTDKQEQMKAWCALAVKAIGDVKAKANATLTIEVVPPKCSASISAKANCQAKCSGSASCDVKANPPKCTGGKLEVSCQGSCSGSANAPSVSCEGGCTGTCSGSCTATAGGVECAGKCDGTCTAGGAAGGNGIQADGTCKGMCTGTCAVTAPSATCEGSCGGSCTGKCEAKPGGAAVKCDGECVGDVEPLKCEGGKLEGGCTASASCDGSCDASVSAKAECTPPSVAIGFSGSADVEYAAKLKATLEANLPLIFAFKARLDGMATLGGTITANASAVADIKAACILAVGTAAAQAVSDVTASASAAGSIIATVP